MSRRLYPRSQEWELWDLRCLGRLESLPCRANGRVEWNLPSSLPKGAAKYCEFSRPIKFHHLDVPDSDQHLLRRAPKPSAQKRSCQRRLGRNAPAGAAGPGSTSLSSNGAGARPCFAHETPARRLSPLRGRGFPPCGNRGDAGNYRDRFEEHTFPGEEKSSPDP